MRRVASFAAILGAIVLLAAVAAGQKTSDDADALEGALRVHPKFHYRFYVDGFGDGQHCALFGADERLAKIAPGTRIRVRGNLASRFFGNAGDKTSALASTWIIYMNVKDVEAVRR
jgi:hypothetical protein